MSFYFNQKIMLKEFVKHLRMDGKLNLSFLILNLRLFLSLPHPNDRQSTNTTDDCGAATVDSSHSRRKENLCREKTKYVAFTRCGGKLRFRIIIIICIVWISI